MSATAITLLVIGVVLCCIEGLFAAGVAALSRITRAEAAEAFTSGAKGGMRIVSIVAKRGAAITGLTTLRLMFTALGSLCLVLALDEVTGTWWTTALAFLGIFAVIRILVSLASPVAIGQRSPVRILSMISRPTALVTALAARTGVREPAGEETEQLQEDQLAVMVERVSDSVVLDENDRELLQSVFDLNHTLVREVMVPRTDMVTIAATMPLSKAMSLFNRSGFSRVPVVGETVDDLLGVVYLKDALRRHLIGNDNVTVADIMREPVFVPETKVVDELMRDMQAQQVHIALVVDEYGGIAGLVTIEDIVEELVGEISDEHDRSTPDVDEIEPGVFRVPARMNISDFGELFGLRIEDDDVDSVGGLFAKLIGRVPIAGARASTHGILMEADHFEGRRRRMSSVIARREEQHDDE